MILISVFIHSVDESEHGFTLRLSVVKHDDGDAMPVGPMAPFSPEDFPEFTEGKIVNRIRAIHDDCKGLARVVARRVYD
jgi:hypothetical protein